jgi:hypothetical protein
MRIVSKEFLKIIDEKSDFFYYSEDFERKNSWKTMIEKQKIFDQKNELLESENKENENSIKILDKKIKRKIIQLELKKVCWFGYFANVLNQNIFVVLKIKNLFCLVFTSVDLECKAQIEISEKIKMLQDRKKNLESLLEVNKKIMSEEQECLQSESIGLNENYRILKELTFSRNLMKNLFGGRKSFEDLPIVLIKNEYEIIPQNRLPAPITRGQFNDGRDFFIIRYQEEYYINTPVNNELTQIFFCKSSIKQLMSSETKDQSWHCISTGGIYKWKLSSIILKKEMVNDRFLIKDSGYNLFSTENLEFFNEQIIIDREGFVNKRLYNSLSKFIQEKGDVIYKIC